MNKYEQYRETCFNILNQLRQPNGTFRAAFGPHYNATWIRDNYWNAQSYLTLFPDLYVQTAQTHLDFLKMNKYKMEWLLKDSNVYGKNEYRFIHPKVNYDGSEIEGLQWRFIQADTLMYYFLIVYNGWKQNLNIIRDEEDMIVLQLLIKVIEEFDLAEKAMAHSWEENVEIFSSNIGLAIKALNSAYEMGFDVDRKNLKKLQLKFNQQCPNEAHNRDWDLTLLFLCTFDDLLTKIQIEDIVNGVTLNLERKNGVIRYKDDVYRPFKDDFVNEEMEWLMGWGYLGLIHIKQGNIEAGKQYIDKIINAYPDGRIPEGTDKNGKPCENTPLAWSITMCIQAINALLK